MAATWTTPKFDWVPPDGIADTDLNRIEENTQYLYERDQGSQATLRNYLNDFEVTTNLDNSGSYTIAVRGGMWVNSDGSFVDWGDSYNVRVKTLTASNWTAGDGGESKLTGATYTTDGWFWVFALYNPTTNAFDFAVDDRIDGTNLGSIAASGFTQSRRICALRTSSLLGSSGIIPMVYYTHDKTMRFAGEIASREKVNPIAFNTSTQILLEDSNNNPILPVDVSSALDGGLAEIQVSVTSGTTPFSLTLWNPADFGTTWYNGIGQTHVYSNTSEVHTFLVQLRNSPEEVQAYCSSTTTLYLSIRSMMYHTNKRQSPAP